jgi:RNA polymerase sigma factor (TIGR02999 family)
LVHEVYLRLARQERAEWNDPAHFLAVAAQQMRRVLVDSARRHDCAKRGGGRAKVPLGEFTPDGKEKLGDLLALDDALKALAEINAEHARIVELRFFGGLTIQEAAWAMGVSARTADRMWRCARAWLYRELASRET